MRQFILVLAALGLTSGAALADRHGGGGRGGEHGGGHAVAQQHWNGGGYRGGGGGVRVTPTYRGGYENHARFENHGFEGRRFVDHDHDRGYYNRGYYNGGYYARRPVYVNRPFIHDHYYDYYRRPALIVENYSPMAGYYWMPGQWNWDGYEWIWQPGHYEPDPAYSYDYGY